MTAEVQRHRPWVSTAELCRFLGISRATLATLRPHLVAGRDYVRLRRAYRWSPDRLIITLGQIPRNPRRRPAVDLERLESALAAECSPNGAD